MGSTARRSRVLPAMVVAVVVATTATTGTASGLGDPPSAGPLTPPSVTVKVDRYGGDLSVRRRATGRFRTERIGGRWWLITPEGHPYWFTGIANADPRGTADRNGRYAYAEAVARKNGTVER